jgi:hypothetical protein
MLQYGRYLLYLLIYTLTQYFIVNTSTILPARELLIDGLIHGSILILLGLFIWKVLLYGNFEALNIFQKLINLIGLSIFCLIIWLGTAYALENILLNNTNLFYSQIIPLRSVIGAFSYLLIVQRFQIQTLENRIKEKETKLEENPIVEKRRDETLLDRVTVKSGTKIHVVEIAEILYFQADGDYVQIHTTDGRFLKEQTMKYFEENLPENRFVRVHRSVIVNIEMISRIELHEKSSQQLTLKNGEQIKTSVAGYKALKIALNL